MLTAPFHHVAFADFWLADQLNSLVVAILDMEYLSCFYALDFYSVQGEVKYRWQNFVFLVCTQHSFAFTVLSMSQTRWQMKLITLKKTIPTKFNLNSNTSCRIIPVKPNGLYVSSIYQDTVQMLKNISFRGKLSMQRQFVL